MRILLALSAFALLGAAPAPAPLFSPGPVRIQPMDEKLIAEMKRCGGFTPEITLVTPEEKSRAVFKRLGDLPPANEYAAVLRRGPDGCPDPLILARGLGLGRR